MNELTINPGLQDHRGQGKKAHFCTSGLWTYKPSDLASHRDLKTWEELKTQKISKLCPFVYKGTVESNT